MRRLWPGVLAGVIEKELLSPALALGVALMGFSLAALAAPKSELWPRWSASTQNKVAIDHADWDAFLQANVKPNRSGIHVVAYGKVSAAYRKALDAYVARMQTVTITKFSRPEQRAYWINLYNATTVKVVLDHYPVQSITKINISPGLFANGPWGKKLLKIEGEDVSLNDIEHRILRPIWKDPRTQPPSQPDMHLSVWPPRLMPNSVDIRWQIGRAHV